MFTESDDMFAADFDVNLFDFFFIKIVCRIAGIRLNHLPVGYFKRSDFCVSPIHRVPDSGLQALEKTLRRTPTSGTTGLMQRDTTVSLI